MLNKIQKDNLIEIKDGRGIDKNIHVLLFSKSAGRCELCNEILIKDMITKKDVILGEMAHIYAFSKGGPRSDKNKINLNTVENLMLLCPSCHNKIDKNINIKYYTVEFLKEMKKDHEDRIKLLTGFNKDRKTQVLKMVANINNEIVKTSMDDIVNALMQEKMFSCNDNPHEIDFTNVSGINNSTYWQSKQQEINEIVNKFYESLKRDKIGHVSIFAIGPIPLLMHLGSNLENKIKCKIFQRHRDGENWHWEKGEAKAKYKYKIETGKNEFKVALLLSLSGLIDRSLFPTTIDENYFIYELYLESNPNYNFLRTEKDLHNFEKIFTTLISEIKNQHRGIETIEIFPAVPSPVAVVCGRALNKNSDPKLKIYNLSNKKMFEYALTIN